MPGGGRGRDPGGGERREKITPCFLATRRSLFRDFLAQGDFSRVSPQDFWRSMHGTLARVPQHGIPGQDMTRGKDGESARLFDKWTDLEVILIGCFYQFRDTVLRK